MEAERKKTEVRTPTGWYCSLRPLLAPLLLIGHSVNSGSVSQLPDFSCIYVPHPRNSQRAHWKSGQRLMWHLGCGIKWTDFHMWSLPVALSPRTHTTWERSFSGDAHILIGSICCLFCYFWPGLVYLYEPMFVYRPAYMFHRRRDTKPNSASSLIFFSRSQLGHVTGPLAITPLGSLLDYQSKLGSRRA